MGVILPFARPGPGNRDLQELSAGEAELRLQLLENSIKNYQQQIDNLENVIRQRCAHELDLLDELHNKIAELRAEQQRLGSQRRVPQSQSLS